MLVSPTLRRPAAVIAALLAACLELVAALSRGDASWDMRNYHIYDPFALLHKAWGVDIAPAHMQTFFSPTMDLYYYSLARTVPITPLLNALVALPHALALVLTFLLTCRLMPARSPAELVLAGLGVVVGAGGAAAAPTLATTMDEMLPSCFVLLALLVLVPSDAAALPGPRRIFAAGLLAGAACGLKLTFTYAAAGLALALFAIPARKWRSLLTRPVWLALGGALGAGALSGYWWAIEWSRYGNPLFPVMNQVFHSPYAQAISFVDGTYLPQSLREALLAPWIWALHVYPRLGESPIRDPRFALGVIAAILCLAQAGAGRRLEPTLWRRWPVVFVAAFFLIAFALWRVQFSIYRYLSLLELFVGPLLVLAALPLARRLGQVRLTAAGVALLAAGLLAVTVYPSVARAPRGTPPFAVDLGPIAPGAMVLLLDNAPMGYLAAFADPSVRFVATNDFFMPLNPGNPMQAQVAAAIAGHAGELWGLDSPAEQGDRGDQSLAFYRLVRGACRTVVSNLSPNPIRKCELRKAM